MKRLIAPELLLMAVAVSCSHSNGTSTGIAVVIQPSTVTMAPGQSMPFAATVSGTSDQSVTWSMAENVPNGAVTTDGVYTAPANQGIYHVVATSRADSSKSAIADVTVVVDDAGTPPIKTGPSPDASPAEVARVVPPDVKGWTQIQASADSRIIHVSSSQGSDSNDGLTEARPMKTLAKATALLRPGYPDWLLLKSGDVWTEALGTFSKIGGRSTGEPMVFSSYGTGARPQLRPAGKEDGLFGHINNAVSAHVFVIGLDFYDPRMDPASPSFQKGVASVPGIRWIDGGDDLLVEDCYFRFLSTGIIIQPTGATSPQNVRLRRNVVTDMYANQGHSQGFYLQGITNLLIEENIFDHNAWNDQAGVPADVFNHHLYIVNSNNMTIRGNLLLRDGSLNTKFTSLQKNGSVGAVIENNFIFESEIGISLKYQGTSAEPTDGSSFSGFNIRNNVLLQINRDNPTKRDIGWGIELRSLADSVISGNIFSDFSFTSNTCAIDLTGDTDASISSGITIQNNLAYRIHDQAFLIEPKSHWSNIKVVDNTICDPNLGAAMIAQHGSFASVSYANNTYSATGSKPFMIGTLTDGSNASGVTYDKWVSQSGETGSKTQTLTYPDPGRNLDTYVKTLSSSMTLDTFYTAIRTQSKANWHPEYMAATVNDYIRAGFALPAFSSSP